MAILKCKICGGTLTVGERQSVATCEYCGTEQTLPRLDDERKANLYDRAGHFRRNNEFDKAMAVYEQILSEDPTDAESYWSILLCHYGIEYVKDPATRHRVPTVNRAQFTSIFDDENYKSALRCADSEQKRIYQAEAAAINDIQRDILAISKAEEPFDVFLCYKETDANGRRTKDSALASELYHELVREGFKVFFARITLEDKLGTAYEPYIFAALHSAKVMVVLGTAPEHFNAVWVKNEWSRYLALIKNGAKKTLIPAYRDMDAYDLPEEFSHLQAQDMSRLGFMHDLVHGIKKLVDTDGTAQRSVPLPITAPAVNTEALQRRMMLCLEDGEFQKADELAEQLLNQDPENAMAYVGKLLIEVRAARPEDLAYCTAPFETSKNYQRAVGFADEPLRHMLQGLAAEVAERVENTRLDCIYQMATSRINKAGATLRDFRAAQQELESISHYKDAAALAKSCRERVEKTEKKAAADKLLEQQRKKAAAEHEKRVWFIYKCALAGLAGVICLSLGIWYLTTLSFKKDGIKYKKVDGSYTVMTCDEDIYNLTIPATVKGKSVTAIADGAFKDHTSLVSVKMTNSVLSMGEGVFEGCTLLKEVELSSFVSALPSKTFYNCQSLDTVNIYSCTFKTIGDSAFEGCISLKSIYLPANVTTIGTSAFEGCTALNSVSLPDNLQSIGSRSFKGCTSLASLTLNQTLSEIGSGAFESCTALSAITLPKGMRKIRANAFLGCTGLLNVYIDNRLNWQCYSPEGSNKVEFVEVELRDSQAVAALFTKTYCAYEWYRGH